MDICKFINSRDIREYLLKLKYDFTSLEAAWLISQCKKTTLREKWGAWSKLIASMPDCRIEERDETPFHGSLHNFLIDYIFFQQKYEDRLMQTEAGTVFICKAYGGSMREYCSDFEHCLESWKTAFPEQRQVTICKQWLDSTHPKYIEAEVRFDGELMEINPIGLMTQEEANSLYGLFPGLWFDFPTPFRKGDILYNITDSVELPFVMTAIGTQGLPEKIIESHRRIGDTTDMNAWGYYAGGAHGFCRDVMYNYMDCEYYRGSLTGENVILDVLSRYIQGKMELEEFCCAYVETLSDSFFRY